VAVPKVQLLGKPSGLAPFGFRIALMATTNRPVVVVPGPAPSGGATASTNDLRGIKGPVDIPNGWAWAAWLGALLLAMGLAYWWWQRWRKKRAQLPGPVVLPPHFRAKQRLAEALALIHDPRLFCIAVSDAVRLYLEERFDYRAPERTTEEFLAELAASTSLYPDQKDSLAAFLEACDLVKFARFEPTESALRELHESAVRLVEETQHDRVPLTAAPVREGTSK
jgi:hypothetical protein